VDNVVVPDYATMGPDILWPNMISYPENFTVANNLETNTMDYVVTGKLSQFYQIKSPKFLKDDKAYQYKFKLIPDEPSPLSFILLSTTYLEAGLTVEATLSLLDIYENVISEYE